MRSVIAPQRFSGVITVASRIVDTLSSGLYESPAACLKELINNSYDADARQVNVFVKPDANRIIIEDNGCGMSRSEFERHFQRISESHKRDESDTTPSGRKIIGRIGIGFIAANEICDVMEIFSTKVGSSELLHVNINFKKMRLDPVERRQQGTDFEKGDYEGEILTTDSHTHYTHVFLKEVRGRAQGMLAGATRPGTAKRARSLYGLSPESVVQRLADPSLKSWSEFDEYSEAMLRVALNVPIHYYPAWVPRSLKSQVSNFERAVNKLRFAVSYDGSSLGKPVVFRPAKRGCFINKFKIDNSHVAARGYFYVQHGGVRPQDLNGLLIRIRHSAVGGYNSTFLDFPATEGALFQTWISAEIWADDRLEEALNIDRKTLRITHPAYVALQSAIHEHLSRIVKQARSRLYDVGSVARQRERAVHAAHAIDEMIANTVAPLSKPAARTARSAWRHASKDRLTEKHLLRRFDVAQLYRIVLDVAREVMTPSQLTRFIKKLTERLTR
jgi:Histidine kinase-, DNA gyrase B-, and HSP90-like ATPase